MRLGKIISSVTLRGDEAEAIEVVVKPSSPIANKAVKDVKIPKGCLILCFQRGVEVVIPRGDTLIEAEDRLIIISLRQNIGKLEKALTTKVERF